MLRSKNLTGVLSQAVQENRQGSTIISSILVTPNGRLVASFHNSRPPPVPHAGNGTTTTDKQTAAPYNVDRTMRTKVYGLFASSTWSEYTKADAGCEWLSVRTDDALMVIHNVNLKQSGQNLLLVIVADPSTALGLMQKRATETVKVMEEGLEDFKVYE